jgi:hypothetical protein
VDRLQSPFPGRVGEGRHVRQPSEHDRRVSGRASGIAGGCDAGYATRPPRRLGRCASTGALRLLDYDVVAALSDIYQTQELFATESGRFAAEMHATAAYDPAMRIVGVRQASAELSEVAYAEKLLVDLYRRHLPAIRAAAGH